MNYAVRLWLKDYILHSEPVLFVRSPLLYPLNFHFRSKSIIFYGFSMKNDASARQGLAAPRDGLHVVGHIRLGDKFMGSGDATDAGRGVLKNPQCAPP